MDATVRNAKVNMRRSGVKKGGRGRRGGGKKEERTFAFPKCFLLYHHLCNLTSPPSVITFRGEDNCCVRAALWPPLIFQGKEKKRRRRIGRKAGHELGSRGGPVSLLTVPRATATYSRPLEKRSGCQPRRLADSLVFFKSRPPEDENEKRGRDV